jgi:hypothetical protein
VLNRVTGGLLGVERDPDPFDGVRVPWTRSELA